MTSSLASQLGVVEEPDGDLLADEGTRPPGTCAVGRQLQTRLPW